MASETSLERVYESTRARARTHLQDEEAVVVEVDSALTEQLRDLRGGEQQ